MAVDRIAVGREQPGIFPVDLRHTGTGVDPREQPQASASPAPPRNAVAASATGSSTAPCRDRKAPVSRRDEELALVYARVHFEVEDNFFGAIMPVSVPVRSRGSGGACGECPRGVKTVGQRKKRADHGDPASPSGRGRAPEGNRTGRRSFTRSPGAQLLCPCAGLCGGSST